MDTLTVFNVEEELNGFIHTVCEEKLSEIGLSKEDAAYAMSIMNDSIEKGCAGILSHKDDPEFKETFDNPEKARREIWETFAELLVDRLQTTTREGMKELLEIVSEPVETLEDVGRLLARNAVHMEESARVTRISMALLKLV